MTAACMLPHKLQRSVADPESPDSDSVRPHNNKSAFGAVSGGETYYSTRPRRKRRKVVRAVVNVESVSVILLQLSDTSAY